VRALPFSQVKSANANGAAASAFGEVDCFAPPIDCGWTASKELSATTAGAVPGALSDADGVVAGSGLCLRAGSPSWIPAR
jgi:hypothetical protein